jgi:hypothetical protein
VGKQKGPDPFLIWKSGNNPWLIKKELLILQVNVNYDSTGIKSMIYPI